jgi:hypothetical protein
MWDGNVNFTYPHDVPAETSYRIAADSSFTVHGWIYRNASNPVGIIYNIPTTFTSVSAIMDSYDTQQAYQTPLTTDGFTVSGRPQLKMVSPYLANVGQGDTYIDLIGDMFQFVTDMGVSGTPVEMYTFAPSALSGTLPTIPASCYNYFNPYVSSHAFSAIYSPFSAVSVTNWGIIDDNYIRLQLPTPLTAGYVDIFAWGPAGFGKLTLDAIRPTFNPFASGTLGYNSFINFQFPYVSGIEIV